jgi:hypothetical protein
MTTILNQSGVVFFGPRANPKAVRWWAERGQLHWEDSRDSSYGVVAVREFLLRLKAINEMLSNGSSTANKDFMHADEVERHMRFIEEGVELAKKAKEQGMPQDAKVRRHKLMDLPVSVAMPSTLSVVSNVIDPKASAAYNWSNIDTESTVIVNSDS